uniref:C3H1-type domain-containing protein n=1 Tax=Alexandrium catenella TaxID=2925 RepID=A0A7S1RSQ0_ALECA
MDEHRIARKQAAQLAAAQAAASVNDRWREGSKKKKSAKKDPKENVAGPDLGKVQVGGSSSSSSAATGPASVADRRGKARHRPHPVAWSLSRPLPPCLAPLARTKLTPCPFFVKRSMCVFGFQCPLAHSLEEVNSVRRRIRRVVEQSRKRSSSGSSGSCSSTSAARKGHGKRRRRKSHLPSGDDSVSSPEVKRPTSHTTRLRKEGKVGRNPRSHSLKGIT